MANLLAFGDKIIGSRSGGGSTGGGHVIENATGSSLTQRDVLQFAGYLKATDDNTNEVTIVDDSPTEITYANWLLLTPEEKADVKWLITGAPGGSGGTSWGSISGTLSNQTDLIAALNSVKADVINYVNTNILGGLA